MSVRDLAPANPVLRAIHRTLFPLFLLVVCPPTAMLLWHTHVHLDGSVMELLRVISGKGLWRTLAEVWGPVFSGSRQAWAILGLYAAFEAILMRLLPGPRFEGPVTPEGNVPVYRANGPLAFVVTVGAFVALSFGLELFSPSIIYDHFGELLGALNLFALLFCLGLYLKGRFAPSSSDHSVAGNFIFDYYWGTELFPRAAGWDIKMFTNCRFAMMGWGLIVLSFAAAQAERHGLSDSMLIAVALQLIYCAKFFWWETGYLGSLDIMHDRAGFYICWGVLVWLPSVYTSGTLFLVDHPVHLGLPVAAGIAALGVASIFANYFADAQRQRVRATDGECRVWGSKPEVIRAAYVTAKGEKKESLLLLSGFWGLSRHFHYLPEILAAFFWSLPALFTHVLPYFYVIFLSILLLHRSIRDDKRCAAKYGIHWDQYRQRVPWRIIPGLF